MSGFFSFLITIKCTVFRAIAKFRQHLKCKRSRSERCEFSERIVNSTTSVVCSISKFCRPVKCFIYILHRKKKSRKKRIGITVYIGCGPRLLSRCAECVDGRATCRLYALARRSKARGRSNYCD